MYKILFSLVAMLLFAGCGSPSGSSSTTENTQTDGSGSNSDYISGIPSDTTENTNIAVVPHHKSSIPMLVVLVSYNNQVISSPSPESRWSQKIFGENAHELNNYYEEASNGHFKFEKAHESYGTANDGIVSVRLSKDHPNTDINSPYFTSRMYPDLAAALTAADDYVDFSNYDTNADGHITPDELIITFIIAGYEDAYEGRHVTNGVWAHQYCMESSSNVPTLDGVDLMSCQYKGNFALFGEKHDISNPHDATIGIIAHELGHATFALPDLYNTAGDYGGIGYFGLMGAGTWGSQNSTEYPGNTPVHFCAWSKTYMGWVTPYEHYGSTTLNATSSSSYNVIKIPISANHYYLLENRNNSGYDKGLYLLNGNFEGGIAVWHINQNKLTVANFEANSVNTNVSDKGVDLVEAADPILDTYKQSGGDEKALFYYPNVTAFGEKVTDISARGNQMTFNIN